ncbi:rhomboid family intramembrane serine protease [Streptomyces griseoviridis]|uniref:Membrane associated rhomboid family serine protease n=1 Tax=Streptomyces griseoviridis TaxID=45398 RepID=A0ABT9LGX1_STRGD|nr:rhomboid family intramembrane serine protease [Streptomyces griseoviridis]MDP9682965.1 membrane associated rhomboid family serine protease [Streptomyces griseoviridis]GGS90364.1 rhomboid family intramembrane serine protease [Streptomyces griseoviridis]
MDGQAAGASPHDAGTPPVCYRHPGRPTGVRCTRCERPVCTDCMIDASVGFQCPECVHGGASRSGGGSGRGSAPRAGDARPRTLAGGTVAADPRLLTKILIGIDVAVFVAVHAWPSFLDAMVLIGRWPPQPFVPTEGVAEGEWYRLVTTVFTHQEIWHIAFNMLSLWWLGGPLEQVLGRVRYLALYLVSGLAGSALTYLLASPTTATLGASGAVFGLFGATAVLMRRLNQDLRPVIALLVINLVFTFSPGFDIAWQAHIGGLVAGLVVGYGMVHAPRERRTLVQSGTCALVLVLCVGLTLLRTAQLT